MVQCSDPIWEGVLFKSIFCVHTSFKRTLYQWLSLPHMLSLEKLSLEAKFIHILGQSFLKQSPCWEPLV